MTIITEGVKVIQKLKLPKEPPIITAPASHLTCLESKIYPIYVSAVWAFDSKSSIDFDTLKNGVKRLLSDSDYASVLSARYSKRSDGRWLRSNIGVTESVLVVEAKAPQVQVNGCKTLLFLEPELKLFL